MADSDTGEGEGRRKNGDRREDDLPIKHDDRREGERRSGDDRRNKPRT